MTWGVKPKPELGAGAEDVGNIVHVGCDGYPRRNTTDNNGKCKVWTGDTPCTECLPIVCLKPENLPRPNYGVSCHGYSIPHGAYYCSWSGGHVGLTRPVQGKDKGASEDEKNCDNIPEAKGALHHFALGAPIHPGRRTKLIQAQSFISAKAQSITKSNWLPSRECARIHKA